MGPCPPQERDDENETAVKSDTSRVDYEKEQKTKHESIVYEEDEAKAVGEIVTSRHEEEQKKKTVVDVKNFSFGSAPLPQEGRVWYARIGRRASEKYKYNG